MTHLDLRTVKACPLCGSFEANGYPPAPRNLYSEKMAGLLDISESRLLDAVSNVQCQSCELIYKQQWFRPDVLRALFSDCVPLHPKGWDAVSRRFSAENFQREAVEYREALERDDQEEIARYRRALRSIIDSIRNQSESARLEHLRTAIEKGRIEALLAEQQWLTAHMDEPAPYSRFVGFSSPDLWQYMEERIGPIHSYGEAGCPLWGLLQHADKSNVQAIFVERDEPNYWGNGCRVDGQGCLAALLGQSGIKTRQWHDTWNDGLDVFGLFQYLDHLEQPDQFIAEAAARAGSLAIILDGVSEPPAVQHFTGWPATAIEALAKRHGFLVHADFDAIRASGNHLYLLERDRNAKTL